MSKTLNLLFYGSLFTVVTLVVATLVFLLGLYFMHLEKPVALNMSSSVHVFSPKGGGGGMYGSGVVFINQNKTFVWTCGHVVANNAGFNPSINFQTHKVLFGLQPSDVEVHTKLFNKNFQESGLISVKARIIRYSYKDDLALLELNNTQIFQNSVVFPNTSSYAPNPGSKVFHIGSMGGPDGFGSVSEGIYGLRGIDRFGQFLDRVGMGLEGGSSGGGVFESNSGRCVGLMAQKINVAQGYIIPFREMFKYCQRVDCVWAMDPTIEVPSDYRKILTDDTSIIPAHVLKILEGNP